MRSIVVKERQTLFDIATLHCGSAEVAMLLAMLNDVSITAKLVAGSNIFLPDVVDEQVTTELTARRAITATDDEERYQLLRGVGYWQVGQNLTVQTN